MMFTKFIIITNEKELKMANQYLSQKHALLTYVLLW